MEVSGDDAGLEDHDGNPVQVDPMRNSKVTEQASSAN